MIKIAVSGSCGKMGQRIIDCMRAEKELQLVCALEQAGHLAIGKRCGPVAVSASFDDIRGADVLIEFTAPEATMLHLDFARKHRKPIVIGTTGLDEGQVELIHDAARDIAIVFSPNMSVGVNVLFELVRSAARTLPGDYTIKIVEAHHVHKKDAPSGTAKRIASIIAEEGRRVDDVQSIREGETVGDHRVVFEGPHDRIELMHSAASRDIFARGALAAARWLVHKKQGLYSMADVLTR
jgi:4-hydroxy-tetrahydrodipicolinate reductase